MEWTYFSLFLLLCSIKIVDMILKEGDKKVIDWGPQDQHSSEFPKVLSSFIYPILDHGEAIYLKLLMNTIEELMLSLSKQPGKRQLSNAENW
jgi:hypothetical protein